MTLLDDARALGPVLRSYSDEAESLRRLPLEVVRLLAEGGFFKLGLPEQYGGAEVDPMTFVEIVAELGRHDAAAAWCSMIASTTAPMAAHLPEADDRRDLRRRSAHGHWRRARVERRRGAGRGGLSGHRPLAMGSGTQHCAWICGGTIVGDDLRLVFFPAADVEILDTWYSSGLRGTGSTDFVVADVLVPEGRTVVLGKGLPPAARPPALPVPVVLTSVTRGRVGVPRHRTACDR